MYFLVDIPMCVFNHEKYIAQAIEGVISQKTDFKIRLFVGEDASTDNTRKIVVEYSQKYPEIIFPIFHVKNLGAMGNSNILLSRCTSKYIALCDGDDYWTDPYKLQKQVDFLETNPDFGMVHTDADVLFQNTGVIIKRKNFTSRWSVPDGDIYDLLLRGIFIKTFTVLIRKEIVERFFKNVKSDQWTVGDLPLFLFISKHSKVKYFNYSTGVYRILKKSATHQESLKERAIFMRGLFDIELFFGKNYGCSKETKDFILKVYNERKIEIGFYELNNQFAKEGFEYLKRNKSFSVRYFLFYLGSKNTLLQKSVNLLLKLKKAKRIVFREN